MSALEFIRWIPNWPDWTKVLPFVFVYFAFCYVVKIWSDGDQNLLLSNYVQFVSNISSETLTPIVPSASQNSTTLTSSPPLLSPPELVTPSPRPPPRPLIERFGILNENGTMTDVFELGDFDDEGVNKLGNWSEAVAMSVGGEGTSATGVNRFLQCVESMMDYIPCMDNADAIERLASTARGEKFERHCPEKDKGLNCLVPKPKGYKSPTPWPKSRDEVWFDNIPNAQVAEEEQGQFWLSDNKDMIHFTGRGPKSIDGADEYIDHISQMVPEIAFGRRTRVVLDVGSGVASFGAYLMSRNVLTLSIGLKDVHSNEIQFALERGVPAMVATFTTRRLSYPSQAFDMIHCAQCVKNWTLDDGIWLLEVNRMLRAGRYFVWADPKLDEQWKEMEDLTTRLCWVLLKKEKSNAIWQKPLNNSCYLSSQEGIRPPLCHTDDDPDNVWYINLKACISQLPQNGSGANVGVWPARLQNPPDRLETIHMDALISRKELFIAENRQWDLILKRYWRIFNLNKKRKKKKAKTNQLKIRNVLDMRAGFGGFAAALMNQNVDAWVLNVVPVSGFNTLPVIYDRGLLGVRHDWCEPFDTYPRSYDFLHAFGLFSIERKRCNVSNIMLEMDRILRPGGFAYIHDSVAVINKLEQIGKAMGWRVTVSDTAEGKHAFYRLLICETKSLNYRKSHSKRKWGVNQMCEVSFFKLILLVSLLSVLRRSI